MCRSQSDFIVPSSIWPSTTTTENTMKMEIVDRYLTRLKTIPCKHFQRSIQESSPPEFKLKCPFGNHCHYSHSHPVTKDPYIFSEGELQRRRKPRRRSQILDEMAIMEMLFSDLAVGYMSTEEDEDEVDLDDFEDHFGFEAEFFGLSSDFDDFGYDYGWD
jgi:E3 ubiquitin-protein ligase makorin